MCVCALAIHTNISRWGGLLGSFVFGWGQLRFRQEQDSCGFGSSVIKSLNEGETAGVLASVQLLFYTGGGVIVVFGSLWLK